MGVDSLKPAPVALNAAQVRADTDATIPAAAAVLHPPCAGWVTAQC
jgi:hypothetical protein